MTFTVWVVFILLFGLLCLWWAEKERKNEISNIYWLVLCSRCYIAIRKFYLKSNFGSTFVRCVFPCGRIRFYDEIKERKK